MIRIGITSLGCSKNLVDSELMLGLLKDGGAEIVGEIDGADAVIVNTCGFIAEAQQESIETILQLVHLKSQGVIGKVIVAGCLTQIYGEELREQISQVDAWIGVNDFPNIGKIIEDVMSGNQRFEISSKEYIYDHTVPRVLMTPPHYAYVKISEGCNHLCSFCVIPKIKGKQRSRPENSIVKEAEGLIEGGVKELVLIGQDTTEYGKDLGRTNALAGLLRELCKIDGDFWTRVLYTFPSHWTDDLIDVFAGEEKICRYVDVPVQHISDAILKSMSRGEDRSDIEDFLWKIRERIPGVFLRTSIIVGYPGETDAQFEELCRFLEEIRFERLGAFTYSREKGSAAAEIAEQVPDEVKLQRYDRIMRLQQKISLDNNSRLTGKRLKCIVDGPSRLVVGDDEGELPTATVGRTYGDAPDVDGWIFLDGGEMNAGDFVTAEVTGYREYDLIGKVIEE